jgi:hypothetical protein
MYFQSKFKKGLCFISNRQRRKEGTFCASEVAGIEPTPPAPKGSGYVRFDHLATFMYIFPKVTQTSKELKKLKVQKFDLARNRTEVICVIAGTFTAEPLDLI